MAKTSAMDKPLEDSLDELILSGLDAGLLSDLDGNDMPVNAATDCSNILFDENGQMCGRDGWVRRFAVMTGADRIDGCREFTAKDGNPKRVVWADGNLYDCSLMTAAGIIVFTDTYFAGVRVAHAAVGGELVYSDGITLAAHTTGVISGMRVYDPVAGTDEILISKLLPEAIQLPAAKTMTSYDSCLVFGNLTWPDGSTVPEGIGWTVPGDIRTFYGDSQRMVGRGDGGEINCLQPFTMSTDSVSPSNSLFVGKSESACFSLRGPVSDLEEIRIRCSSGVMDGGTVKFIPYTDGGVVIFLATDREFYVTNGVTAHSITEDRIRTEVRDYLEERLGLNPYQRFYAGRDYVNHIYVCNLGGGRWYCFNWSRARWSRFDGWPDGDVLETVDNRRHQLYILELDAVTASPVNTVQMCQMNTGRLDNGVSIEPYWKGCFLRGAVGQDGSNAGSMNKSKLWYFATLDYATDFGALKIEFTPDQGRGETQSYTVAAVAVDTQDKYDTALYDTAKYAANPKGLRRTTRFRIPKVDSRGKKSIFRGRDIQVKISLDPSTPDALFKVFGLSLAHTERGMAFVKT
jgi:hypothetical protein